MFKIGDKVIIREDLEAGKVYGGVSFISRMREFLGKEATITGICYAGGFLLDIDDEVFSWSAEMFEPKTDSGSEVLGLSKPVIEYEDKLEAEADYYETKYTNLVEKYNVLVEKYNALLEELKEDYI
jgi:hypothetical protein